MPDPSSSLALRGLAWVTFANSLFAVMTIAARLASRSASWTTVGGTRAFVGALVALVVALHRGAPLKTTRRGLSWARSLLGTGAMLATFYAVSAPDLGISTAVTLFSTAPIFIALLSPKILGEKPARSLWGILLVAFGGIVLVAGTHLDVAAFPAFCALLAAVFSAMAMMFLRLMRSGNDAGQPESAEAIAFHFGAVAFVAHAVLGVFSFKVPTLEDTFWLVVTGVSGGVAQLAMTRAYALTEAARLGAVGYIGTVMGFVGSVVFLAERPDALQIAGALLVVGAGIALAITSAGVGVPHRRATVAVRDR